MAKKPAKKRADKYNEKLHVKGSFDDLMGALFPKNTNKSKTNVRPKKKSTKKK